MNQDARIHGPLAKPTIYCDAGRRPIHGVMTVELMALVCGEFSYKLVTESARSTCQAELWAIEWGLSLARKANLKNLRLIGDNKTAMLLMSGANVPRKGYIVDAVQRCRNAALGFSVDYLHMHRTYNLAGIELGVVQTQRRRGERQAF